MSDPAEKVRVRLVSISPEIALKLLKRNEHNRGMRARRVEQYAGDLRAGDWQLNGEAIKIDWNGQILDGQHRLMAVLEADRPMLTVLITGLDPRSQETMDQGLPRTAADALRLRGEMNPNTLGAAVRIVFIYLRYGRTFTAGKPAPTIGQILHTLDRCPEIRESVKLATRLSQPYVTRSLMAALHFLFGCVDQDRATEFMRRLAQGGDGPPGVLHMLLRGDVNRGEVQHARVKGALIVLAWNAWRDGQPFSVCVPAVFPEIAGFHGSFESAGRGEVSSQSAPRPAQKDSLAAAGSLRDDQREAARAMLEAAA